MNMRGVKHSDNAKYKMYQPSAHRHKRKGRIIYIPCLFVVKKPLRFYFLNFLLTLANPINPRLRRSIVAGSGIFRDFCIPSIIYFKAEQAVR